jgi:hypothetical protein
LPYKIGNPPVSAAKATLSFWTEPQVGAPTFVRVVPQVSDQPVAARVLWSFDGRPVLDSAVSRDPRYPIYFTKRILPAKVWTRGIHTWKVDVTYGTWPNEKTASTTWKQTFY